MQAFWGIDRMGGLGYQRILCSSSGSAPSLPRLRCNYPPFAAGETEARHSKAWEPGHPPAPVLQRRLQWAVSRIPLLSVGLLLLGWTGDPRAGE